MNRQKIRGRVWERGTRIRTGLRFRFLRHARGRLLRSLSDRRAVVILDGGELIIEWRESDSHVIMAGPASLAYKGTLSEEITTPDFQPTTRQPHAPDNQAYQTFFSRSFCFDLVHRWKGIGLGFVLLLVLFNYAVPMLVHIPLIKAFQQETVLF